MPSKNKTPLGLNQWAETETPKRDDFNSDNLIIDEAFGSFSAIAPTYSNSWVAASGNISMITKSRNQVNIQLNLYNATVTDHAANEVILTLPEGYRPRLQVRAIGSLSSAWQNAEPTTFFINTDGTMVLSSSKIGSVIIFDASFNISV